MVEKRRMHDNTHWCSCCGQTIPEGIEVWQFEYSNVSADGRLTQFKRIVLREHLLDWGRSDNNVLPLNTFKSQETQKISRK